MKKYIIARNKSGLLRMFNTMAELKKEIDNISSWLSVKAGTAKEAFQKFPILEKKYTEIYDNDKLKHIIDLSKN